MNQPQTLRTYRYAKSQANYAIEREDNNESWELYNYYLTWSETEQAAQELVDMGYVVQIYSIDPDD